MFIIFFHALRLLFLPNCPGPSLIPCPTSIPDSRVITQLQDINLNYRGLPMKVVKAMELKRSLRQEKIAARRATKRKNRIKNRKTQKPKRPKNKNRRKN